MDVTKSIMSNLSGYGVKNILPLLLDGLKHKAWRAVLANIGALGNMAYCAPKQLSGCLPLIVPSLSKTLTTTHPKIRDGASQALKLIGSTIKNSEISSIADILIKAISDPFEYNVRGLNVLLKTQFVHYIDAPALSLLIPIIDYGLRSKQSEMRQKTC